LSDELDDAFAVIDLLTQEATEVTALSAENILPCRLVTQKYQCIRHKLPRTVKLMANS
jgi:hypothetical protein